MNNWVWLGLALLLLGGASSPQTEAGLLLPPPSVLPPPVQPNPHEHVPGFHQVLAGGLFVGQTVTVRIQDALVQGTIIGDPFRSASGSNLWPVALADGGTLDAVPETAISVL